MVTLAGVGHAQERGGYDQPDPGESSEYVLDEPPPSSGLGLVISGSVLTGLGALNMATSPICLVDSLVRDDIETACVAACMIVGGTMFAVGLPLLIVGVVKRGKYKEWREQHPGYAALTNVGVSAGQHGAGLVWHTEF